MNNIYFTKIDGIRGIAVLLVFFYHSGLKFFEGGYIGVDIFFTISGFIITHTILRDKKSNSFSFIRFFEKRFRRILPVLLIVILVSLFIGALVLDKDEAESLANSSLYNLIFLSNFYYHEFKGAYFSTSSLFLPLIHTWSISIEMQFYFICFFIFYLIFSKKNQLLIIIILSLLSIFLSQLSGNLKFSYPYIENELLLFNQTSLGSFFQPFGRFWEFAFGSILAILLFNKPIKIKNNIFLEFLGLLLILISFVLFKYINGIPNLSLLIPLIGSIFLIISSTQESKNFSLLNNFFLKFIGIISYSIFIIHQPIYVYLRYVLSIEYNFLIIPITIILTIILSFISWNYLEKTFRNYTIISSKKFYLSISILVCLILSISLCIKYKIINLNTNEKIEKIYKNINFSQTKHIIERSNYFKNYKKNNKIILNQNKKNILILGDSLAEGLFIALNENTKYFEKLSFIHLNLNKEFNFFKKNLGFESSKYDFLNKNPKFISADYILITKRFNNRDIINLPYFIDYLKYKNKEVIISDYRQYFYGYFEDPLFYILKNQRFSNKQIYSNNEIDKILFSMLEEAPDNINLKLKKISNQYKIKFIKYSDLNCNISQKKCYSTTDNGHNIYFAQNHYTILGAKFLGKLMFERNWLNLN
jgi:peptidoglycan/LPS O-acetylase OafA/YrhL